MTTSAEHKVFQHPEALGFPVPEPAACLGLPEAELRQLCHQSDPPLSRLGRRAYFPRSSNVLGVGNRQTTFIGQKAARQLAPHLNVCYLAKRQSEQLVAAKNELIALRKQATGYPTS